MVENTKEAQNQFEAEVEENIAQNIMAELEPVVDQEEEQRYMTILGTEDTSDQLDYILNYL